jgi:hypothetical protein
VACLAITMIAAPARAEEGASAEPPIPLGRIEGRAMTPTELGLAAELIYWQHLAETERVRRRAAEQRAQDLAELQARTAELAELRPRTVVHELPEWVWPVLAGAAVAAFAGGLLLGLEAAR